MIHLASRLLVALCALFTLLPMGLATQGTRADYDRANSVDDRFQNKLRHFTRSLYWLDQGEGIWWKGADGEFVRVDAKTGARRSGPVAKELGLPEGPLGLTPLPAWKASRGGGESTTVTFKNELTRTVRLFWVSTTGSAKQYGELKPGDTREQNTYAGHVWLVDFKKDDLAGSFRAESSPGTALINEASRELATADKTETAPAAEPAKVLMVRNFNVAYMLDGKVEPITKNGSPEDPYQWGFHTSPDGQFALGFQTTEVPTREIALVESSPEGQVQPKLHRQSYRKPGDPIPQARPRLFDLGRGRAIPVDDAPFEDSFRVGEVHWAPDSSMVYVVHYARGHQSVTLFGIDAQTGKVTPIIKETSPTFVDYSQKKTLRYLHQTGEVLWASERDGRNHLYRFDATTGELRGRVTDGEYIVRRVDHVDEAAGWIWIGVLGAYPEQDPYYEHLAKVRLDGSDFTLLTAADGTHRWQFNRERTLFLDRWSRVDQATVTELRRTTDGSLVAELGRDDPAELFEAGFMTIEPFQAKGRDGSTDIFGVIIRPTAFDPSRKYPVIESIYAGPHDQHVPKGWRLGLSERGLAELGFIVVRIDGMGTNWRTKAFHDVCYQNLKDAGFPDRIAWMRAAAKAYPEMDLSRVGIYGGSAGGQNALGALLHHGDFYHAAAADCGCHDNRMDKIWWNEAWMGKLGPHYSENSNVTHAAKLKGKLLLTVGELDRNVDPASTLQVVDALIRADKDFEFVLVPGAGHGVGESPYLVRRRQDFFVRALYGAEPRRP